MNNDSFTLSKYRAAIFLVLALPVFYAISRYNYSLFHSLVDGVSIVIAACVFTIIWNERHLIDNNYYLYVGITFLFWAFLDFMHLLGNKNMGVFPAYGNLGPAFYIASRYILGISLMIAPLFINRKLNATLMFGVYSLITLLILLSILSWQIFPVCIVEGVGLTPFKVVSDYIICLILLGAIGLLLIRGRSFDSNVRRLIVTSIILSIATGLSFTLYTDPFGIMNMVGHFFQIASFYLVYLAFIETTLTKPQDILYRKLKQNEEALLEAHQGLEKKVRERTLEVEKTNTALQSVVAYNRSLFESNIAPFVAISLAGTITDVNRQLETVTGFSRDELIGTDWTDYFTDQGRAQAGFEKVLAHADVRDYELQLRQRNGNIMPVLFHASLYHDESGKVSGVLGVAWNITERKIAEWALKESEQRYRIVADNTYDWEFWLSPQLDYFYTSPSCERITGYLPQEFQQNKQLMLEIVHPDDLPGFAEHHHAEFKKDYSGLRETEFRIIHKDGSVRWIGHLCQPVFNESGAFWGVRGSNRDITDKKQAEQDRIAREVAEKANRAKSIFVANMSHEIRTPLNAVMGFAQMLERDPTLTPQQAEHVRTIHRSGDHLLRLINDILDMSKIEAGRTTLNESAFCLHDLLDDLLLMFRARADSQGLQLLMERDENVPRNVTGDEGKLRQVLVNLLSNAVKFTATGGVAVRVRAEAVAGKTGENKESLRLGVEVEDTGPGIPDEDMDRIFDLFQQAGAHVNVGGTGLGLTISRRFVEMMGGELTVKSKVGTGSCFRFDLLLKPAAEFARRDKRASRRIIGLEPGTGPVRILAVDDAPTNRALLCALLRPRGFEVAEAGNGVEALDIFAKWSPHAILMDMRMPVMDGYEATRRLKATEAGSKTPVIAITVIDFEDTKELVMATGVDAYIRKPFRIEEICEMLGKYLGLRYVFADGKDKMIGDPAPASLNPEARLALPQEIIQAMRQALEEGDSARLRELIAQVEKLDSATARELQALLDRYDYNKLGQWLGKEEIANG